MLNAFYFEEQSSRHLTRASNFLLSNWEAPRYETKISFSEFYSGWQDCCLGSFTSGCSNQVSKSHGCVIHFLLLSSVNNVHPTQVQSLPCHWVTQSVSFWILLRLLDLSKLLHGHGQITWSDNLQLPYTSKLEVIWDQITFNFNEPTKPNLPNIPN